MHRPKSHRWLLALIAGTLVGGTIRPVLGQDGPPSSELAAILGKWKTAILEPNRYEIRGERIIYNKAL